MQRERQLSIGLAIGLFPSPFTEIQVKRFALMLRAIGKRGVAARAHPE